MKIKCPLCGIEGFLQKRGNSYRIQHYRAYVNEKRKYDYHTVSRRYIESLMEVNGNKTLEVNKGDLAFKSEKPKVCTIHKDNRAAAGS